MKQRQNAMAEEGSILELASLPDRHPKVAGVIVDRFVPYVIIRVSLDPVCLPVGVVERNVIVDRMTPGTGLKEVQEFHKIGWLGLPRFTRDYCSQIRRTTNQHNITENAAVGVMALFIHELEGGCIDKVLEIGSGGDYLVTFDEQKTQAEVSGIFKDDTGYRARSRLKEKSEQVLKKAARGFASVTTFSRFQDGEVHSYLHFVEAEPQK